MHNEISQMTAAKYQAMFFWWDWQIPVYLFLGGLTAGLMILISLNQLFRDPQRHSPASRLIAWLPPVLLSLGMFALFLNLTNKWNILRFYTTFEITAPSSWGAWILIIVYPVSIAIALMQSNKDSLGKLKLMQIGKLLLFLKDWLSNSFKIRILSVINLIMGISLGIYTGILLSNLAGRPLWNSALLGPLFLASGLSTGAAFALFFKLNDDEKHLVHQLDLIFILVEFLFIGLFILSMTAGGEHAREAVEFFLGGEFTAVFWGLVIIAGLIVPLIAYLQKFFTGFSAGMFVPILVLIGGLMLRWVLVFAGQISRW